MEGLAEGIRGSQGDSSRAFRRGADREERLVPPDLGCRKGQENGPWGSLVTFKASLWHFVSFRVHGLLVHECPYLFFGLCDDGKCLTFLGGPHSFRTWVKMAHSLF